MNQQLVLPLAGLALLDSVNPSTLVISALIAVDAKQRRRSPWRRLANYLSGVLTVMIVVGVGIMLSLQAMLDAGARTRTLIFAQAVIGVGLLVIGLLPDESRGSKSRRRYELAQSAGAMFALGLLVAVVEFAGAVPYLGALALMSSNQLSVAWWLPLLLLYNLLVILPPVGLVALSQAGLVRNTVSLSNSLRADARPLALTLAFVVGLYLAADAAYYFNVFGIFDSAPPHSATQ